MKNKKVFEIRDLRKYASTTNKRLVLGALFLLFVVGLGLIALIYGMPAALMGLLCLLGAMLVIGVIFLIFYLIQKILDKYRGE